MDMKEKNQKQLQLTKLFPFETSRKLRSELNEVASENILVYKYIDLNIQQRKLSRYNNKRCERTMYKKKTRNNFNVQRFFLLKHPIH